MMTNECDNVTLTAYATGELSADERAAVEARLATDATARAEVSAIRRVIALLRRAFQCEPALRLAASQRAAIEARAGRRRPWLPIVAALAAAAAVLVVAGLFTFASREDTQSSSAVADNHAGVEEVAGEPPRPVGSLPPKKAAPPARSGMVPVPISLPPPLLIGTREPIKGEPNIQKHTGKKRPPFLAPRGTVNLARGKPVTSSDPEPVVGELQYVTDGLKSGRDGSFVELGIGKQSVTIDLRQEATIYAVLVWHYHQNIRAYRDVVVQVGKDRDFIEYKTVFNNDHDNSSGHGKGKHKGYIEDEQGKLIDCKGVRGRYVRLWSKENTSGEGNHYIEVEIYGKPVKK